MSDLFLHQVAGLSAGGSLLLSPGQWDVGPVSEGSRHLDDGNPDEVGFTLSVDQRLSAWVVPGSGRIRLDDEPVVDPLPVGDRMINAGSGRFVVERRPSGGRDEVDRLDVSALHPWLVDPLPQPTPVGVGVLASNELVALRRRIHPGPIEIRRRVSQAVAAGSEDKSIWNRTPDHYLFGLAPVGVADLVVESGRCGGGLDRPERLIAPAPVALDLLARPTVLVGQRQHQLAVASQLLVNLATTVHPDGLCLDVESNMPDLDFVTRLPHYDPVRGSGHDRDRNAGNRRRLLVIDRQQPMPSRAGSRPIRRWPIPADGAAMLILGRRHDPIPPGAAVVTIGDESSLTIHSPASGGRSARVVGGATPIGITHALAVELAGDLGRVER